jgi:hypothetical protein
MAHLPPATDQPLLRGAAEELPGGPACGLLPSALTEALQLGSLPQGLSSRGPQTSLPLDRVIDQQVRLLAAAVITVQLLSSKLHCEHLLLAGA